MPRTGMAGAVDRLEIIAHWEPIARRFQRLAARAPAKAARAMGHAVAWWHARAVRKIPVRASRPRRRTRNTTTSGRAALYARHGRGMLKKSTQPYVRETSGAVRGGVRSGTPYAIWLAAGTRFIAGGRVMRWRPGQPTIKTWPAKRENASTSYGAELPIVLPWQRDARKRLIQDLRGEIAK